MPTIKENSKKLFKLFLLKVKNIFPSFFQKTKTVLPTSLIFKDHLNSNETKEDKIEKEKRKRNQAYVSLDYLLSLTSYFDFFSFDTFQIAKDAKIFTQISNKKIVTSDLLLLPFFYSKSKISEIFQSYGITKDSIEEIIANYHVKSVENFAEKNFLLFKDFCKDLMIYSPIKFEKIIPNPKVKYSLEINRIFEKAAENALVRFKTPVISTEILFITLMEEEDTRAGKIIKKFFNDETQWFLLRYNLIKKLHQQESFLRTEIKPNQHYFAYLLKTKFSDSEFEKLIENNDLKNAVIAFRNELISDVLKLNIYEILEQEIYLSFQTNKKIGNRTYSLD